MMEEAVPAVPEVKEGIDVTRITMGEGITTEAQNVITRAFAKLPKSVSLFIREINVNKEAVEEVGEVLGAFWDSSFYRMTFKTVEKVTPRSIYHETAHGILEQYLDAGNVEIIARYADTIGRTEDAIKIRQTQSAEISAFHQLHEDFATNFANYFVGREVKPEIKAFLEDIYFPELKPPAVSVVEYDRRYTLEQLRGMARQEGLSPSGSKKEIAARLIAKGVK